MTDTRPILLLHEARAIARRAIEKAEDLGRSGTFTVVDEGGIVATASRMDGTGKMSYPVSRAKAYGAAVQREPSAHAAARSAQGNPALLTAIQQIIRQPSFPGPGAQIIFKEQRPVGALSTGLGVPPFVKFPGLDPMKLVIDGKPANAEDLCIAYGLRKPYESQHGDDNKRWLDAYGTLPQGQGTGFAESPKCTKQQELDAAIRLCDAAMAEAARRNVLISVVVVDSAADVVQVDRMDNAAPMTPDAAEALAVTAVNFRASSAEAAKYPDLQALAGVTSFKFLPVPGGLPLIDGGRVVGALGVSGADPKECEAIARVAIGK